MEIEIKRINLKNPIKQSQFIEVIEVLKNANKFQSLIINMGNHDFNSLDDLKFYKIEMTKMQKDFEKFNKVAIFHNTTRMNQPFEHDTIKLFSNEIDAINWVKEKLPYN